MARTLNIACLQTEPKADFGSALDEALMRAEEAVCAGSEVLVLPEYCGGIKTDSGAFVPPSSEEDSHPVLNGLREFCASRKVWIVVGSVAISAPNGRIYNRSFILDNKGCICARYDKLHLFDIELSDQQSYRESEFVSAGKVAVVANTPFAKIGLSICYDLRFPNLYRDLAQAGAELILIPAAFTKTTGEAHWHVLNRARAIETGSFVVSPCATGPVEGGGESYGHSLVVNPWGEVLADGGTQPGVVHVKLDLDEVALARKRIPSLHHQPHFTVCDGASRAVA